MQEHGTGWWLQREAQVLEAASGLPPRGDLDVARAKVEKPSCHHVQNPGVSLNCKVNGPAFGSEWIWFHGTVSHVT